MKFDHIAGIYEWLNEHVDSEELQAQLAKCLNFWDGDARGAILYLPMYSWGIRNPLITPRIEFLQKEKWNSIRFARATDAELNELESKRLPDGRKFGFRYRLDELRARATQLEDATPSLAPPHGGLNEDVIKKAISELRKFHGVGRKAALHVLSDLGWPVFIPDRQLLRFLFRIDTMWRPFLRHDSDSCMLPDEHLYGFLALWNRQAAAITADTRGAQIPHYSTGVPTLDTLKPRQIDILIMLFTQDVSRGAEEWRPDPICNHDPNCDECPISGHCSYFAEQIVNSPSPS